MKTIAVVQVRDGGWVELIPIQMGERGEQIWGKFDGQIYSVW